MRISVERTLPFEVDEPALQRLVLSVGSAMDEAGESRFVGSTFTWSASTNSGRRTEVSVAVHRGATTIRIEERYGELAGGLFGGVLGGVGGGVGLGAGGAVAGAMGSLALAVAFPALVIGGSYLACRFGYREYVRRRARHLNVLCERIAEDLKDDRNQLSGS
ncbi:MAG TPA: hypothetical protein VHG09_01585 [Longimicrobiales bacterium]|nr:hypothetical protein [Longimicrobiales bacterium]